MAACVLSANQRRLGRAMYYAADRGELGLTSREAATELFCDGAFTTAADVQRVNGELRELERRGLVVRIGHDGPWCLTQEGHEVFC